MKINRETAEQDFYRFAEKLNLSERKLETLKEVGKDEKNSPIDEFIDLIEWGLLAINDSDAAVLKLETPIGTDEKSIDEITFKSRRLRVEDLEKKMVGKSDTEKTRRMFSLLTNENPGIFSKMNTEDFANIGIVAQFFL